MFVNAQTTLFYDLFPRWARDLNLINNQFIYNIFSLFFNFQCYVSDNIGVQSLGNVKFIQKKILGKKSNIEVLNNWYTSSTKSGDFKINGLDFRNKKVLVYAGNIGVAQGFNKLIELAEEFKEKSRNYFFVYW